MAEEEEDPSALRRYLQSQGKLEAQDYDGETQNAHKAAAANVNNDISDAIDPEERDALLKYMSQRLQSMFNQ